jgi:hypothetical protein
VAKLTKEDIEKIVQRDAPGHRVVSFTGAQDATGHRSTPDQTTPDLVTVQRKYEGGAASNEQPDSSANNPGNEEAEDEADEDQLVTIEPEQPDSPWAHGARPKVVVVSAKQKRIIATQG